jgi:hypothetical protein
MPAKKNQMTPEEQSEAFTREVRRRIDAGELSPTEADAALDYVVKRASHEAQR